MMTRDNQSYAAISSNAGKAEKLYSRAIRETEADRKAEARKAKWDADNSGDVSEEEAYVAEMAILTRQKAMLDIILLVREKIMQISRSTNMELKKLFDKFDPDKSGTLTWFEFDKALTDLGVNVSMAELEHLMQIFDSDGDGHIYWLEFIEWCDDRVPLSVEKMRKIIAAHEGSSNARKTKANVKAPSMGYMKAWLQVHAASVDADIDAVAVPTQANGSPLVGNVKLLGDAKKVEIALKMRKQTRAEVIDKLRMIITDKCGDLPLEKQLDMVWSRFDVNGDGIINWKEFVAGMKSMGLEFSPEELSGIMKEFDTNCDGALDYVEFVGHLMPKRSNSIEDEFNRLSNARKAMLHSRGISRAGKSIHVKM